MQALLGRCDLFINPYMMMNAIYVLTSEGNDTYSALTRISIASLRLSNPSMRSVVVCDSQSDKNLRACHDPILQEAGEWRVFETPDGPPGYRNRFLKTNLRNLVEGPYVFLDGDTFVRKPLPAFEESLEGICGVMNHCGSSLEEAMSPEADQMMAQMQWPRHNGPFLNGGVLGFGVAGGAYELGELWHSLWKESWKVTGQSRDQTALYTAIGRSSCTVNILPVDYNAQINIHPPISPGARLWHFYSSDGDMPENLLLELAGRLRNGESLNDEYLLELQRLSHPWKDKFWTVEGGGRYLPRITEGVYAALRERGDLGGLISDIEGLDQQLPAIILEDVYRLAKLRKDQGVLRRVLWHWVRVHPGSLCNLRHVFAIMDDLVNIR